MAHSKDTYYYETFVTLVDYSCKAARMLESILIDFNTDELEEQLKKMHEIEHAADLEKHGMLKKLSREFITPIEREDIMNMAQQIDDVTDSIEDVLMRMYMYNAKTVPAEALRMTDIIVRCTEALKEALVEFEHFRRSKKLHDLIIEVNNMEEEGDRMYTSMIRNLYVNSKDPLETICWTRIYDMMEHCCDACEDVAEVIEEVIMKNS